MITLYDLCAANDAVRLSPYCWRTKMALEHKGLDYETVAWRFTEKEAIAATGQGTVPVIVDGGRHIHDSWAIMEYLEATYPEKPLFDSPQARAQAIFIKNWMEKIIHPGFTKQVIVELYAMIDERDKAHFRKTRESFLGMTLEEFGADAAAALPGLRQAMLPLRLTLANQPFVAGDAPNYADYIVFGGFQWARVSASTDMLEADDPIHAWRERMLALYGGVGASVPARQAA